MRHRSIVAWGLIAFALSLGACSKDEPTQQNQGQKPSGGGTDAQPTESVSLQLEMTEEADSELRSLNYTLTGKGNADHMTVHPTDQNREMDGLLILRNSQAESDAPVYKRIKWLRTNYNGTYVWTYRTDDLGLPSAPNKNSWYAMAVVGGTLPEETDTNKKLTIASHISETVDVSTGKVSLNVPYVSRWRPLVWNSTTESFQIIGSNRFVLSPLGIVMTYRVTNNMNQTSHVAGLRVMTTHLEGTGSFDLSKAGLPCTPYGCNYSSGSPHPQMDGGQPEQAQ